MKVFIGCSSSNELDKIYYDEAEKFANYLVDKDCSLVFGGCNTGLMGLMYRTFKDNNKEVLAVKNRYYLDELDGLECKSIITETTADQMLGFVKESDLFVFIPGGFGTYNEFFFIVNEFITKTHNKKMIVYNINHYYDELETILNKMIKERFASSSNFVKIVDNLDDFKSYMEEIC